MSKNIAITFELKTTGEGLKQLIVDSDGLKKALGATFEETQRLHKSIKTLGEGLSISMLAQQANDAFSQLASIVNDLTDAYQAQIEVETQLAVNMRNTMNATDAQIRAIKELCAAQQQIGIIGDEVQLAGAQELATYLEQKEALEELIPVMNDMLAQQYGYSATAENAAQIGAMLGKVMNGQVNALSRLGYKFTEAQKAILTYGDEMQRVATLKDVINQSVGGENTALAQTRTGQIKQMENAMGDLKESAGKALQAFKPFVMVGQQLSGTATSVIRLSVAWYALSKTVLSANIATKTFIGLMRLSGLSLAQAKGQMVAFSAATKASEKAVIGLKMAIRSLMGATVIGMLLVALGAIINKLMDVGDAADDFESAMDRVTKKRAEGEQAMAAEESKLAAIQTLYQINIKRLKEFNGSKAEEKKLVKEMNDTYGETMGYFASVSSWYQTLIADSEAYTRQMVVEAKQRAVTNEITENEELKRTLQKQKEDRREAEDLLNQRTSELQKNSRVGGFLGTTLKANATALQRVARGESQLDKGREYKEGEVVKLNGGKGLAVEIKLDKDLAQAFTHIAAGTKEEFDSAIKEVDADAAKLQSDLESYVTEGANIKMPRKGSSTRPDEGGTGTDTTKSQLDLINEQIKAKQKEYMAIEDSAPNADASRAEIAETIDSLIKQREALETLQKASERPFKLETLADYDRELSYLNAKRAKANANEIVEIDRLIQSRTDERNLLDRMSKKPGRVSEIKTYRQLNDAVNYYQTKLETASATERIVFQRQIERLNQLRTSWERLAQTPPKAMSKLNTREDIDAARGYISERQNGANLNNYYAYAKQLQQVNRKGVKFDNADSIAEQLAEVMDLEGLEGKELKIKVEAIGLEGVRDRIRQIREMLNDTDNPMADQQRKDALKLIEVYGKYEKQLMRSNAKLTDGWGGIKGFGNSVNSLKEAITGSGDAWSKFTTMVDAGISMFESIRSIVGLIKNLCGISETLTAAKAAENAVGQQGVQTDTQKLGTVGALITSNTVLMGQIAAIMGLTAANTAVTEADATANLTDAAAKAFNAHAWLPWVGVGIAAAMVGVMIAQMASMPKFAEGGIISGPTIGLMGEYPGASNNPEVVAPLSKLKDMIADSNGGAGGGHVTFKISGRDLVGVLEKINKYNKRM